MRTAVRVLRFERNELDLGRYELRRAGKRLRLPRAPMELLILLTEERNKLVTRQQIAERLWTEPEAIDVVQGINSAINRLRAVLNDDPARPRFIETVIGKGYRFIAEVDEIQDAAPTAEPPAIAPIAEPALLPATVPEPVPTISEIETPSLVRPSKSLRRARNWLFAACGAGVVVVGLVFLYREHSDVPREKPVFTRLTANDGEDRITASAISPDGKLLAYADSSGVLLRVVESGSEQLLNSPSSFQVDRISWFADDLRLAVSGYESTTLKPQVWLVSVTGKPARLLRDGARNGTPSPDGSAFAYTGNQDAAIWVGDSSGEEARIVAPGAPGLSFPYVFWSADSKRLLYQRKQYAPRGSSLSSPEIEKQYRWSYESADVSSGKILASVPGIRFESACLLPDDRMLFLRWDHLGKALSYALWEVQTDGSKDNLRSSPHRLLTFQSGTASSLSVSGDGNQIAAILEQDFAAIAVGNLGHTAPELLDVKRLTHDLESDYPHSWMPGSAGVLFESSRAGTFEIYKQPLSSRKAEMMARFPNGAILPAVAPGGKWILFAVQKNAPDLPYTRSSYALYRMPVTGGTAEEVAIGGPLDEFRCPLSTSGGCVLRQTIGHQQLIYYSLDPLGGKGAELGRTAWSPTLLGDWDVSPDGSTVELPIHDSANRRIRLVPLGDPEHKRAEREIVVDTFASLGGVAWAADGKGFFAGATTNAGSALLYIDLQGHATVLRKSVLGTWGVPSPDGSKLAFVDYRMDSNVWISDAKRHPPTYRP